MIIKDVPHTKKKYSRCNSCHDVLDREVPETACPQCGENVHKECLRMNGCQNCMFNAD